MLKVELALGDGLGCYNVSLKVLLNSLCSTKLEVIGVKTLHVAHAGQSVLEMARGRKCSRKRSRLEIERVERKRERERKRREKNQNHCIAHEGRHPVLQYM